MEELREHVSELLLPFINLYAGPIDILGAPSNFKISINYEHYQTISIKFNISIGYLFLD